MADERDRLRARFGLQPLIATTPTPKSTPVVDEQTQRFAMGSLPPSRDPYYKRDPNTGLSPAQVEAKQIVSDTKKITAAATAAATVAATAAVTAKPYVQQMPDGFTPGGWTDPELIKLFGQPGSDIMGYRLDPITGKDGKTYYRLSFSTKGAYGDAVSGYQTYGAFITKDTNGKWVQGDPNNPADNKNFDGSNNASFDAQLAFMKAQAAAETQAKRESAFAILKKEFDKYGLGSLVDSVKNLILTGSSPEEVVLKLRETPEYLKRFAGNKLRLDAGLNVYDEATYLDLENAYDQIFTSYGVEEAVGNTRDARRAKYAEFIGGTKSPDEIKGRVQLAVLASQEDAVTKATMKELYPMITDKDLVSYFLNPKETLPKLETKIRAAQVGAAAVRQGLVTNVATAEELVGLGITEEQAEKGYAAYAGMKPRLDFLSSLEKDQQSIVDQQVAEGALLKNLASEQRKILNLQQKEEGRFGGASGAARGVSLSKQLGGTY